MRRERPILFSAPMVRALLAGTKTQTRRQLRYQPNDVEVEAFTVGKTFSLEDGFCGCRCPYGMPRDRLWVKETFGLVGPDCEYRADGHYGPCAEAAGDAPKWKPSIFMPRKLSRLTLEVTDVRVQRLQDISEEDARAEGMDWAAPHFLPPGDPDDREDPREVGYPDGSFARDNFERLWSQINGAESWAANPWVWAISFRVLEAAGRG